MCRPRARRCGATVTRKWRERVQKVFEMNERRRSRHRSYPASFRAKPSFHESEGSDTRKNQSEFSTALTPGNLSRQKSPRLPQTGIVRKCAADAKERTRPALPPGRIQVPYSGATRGSPPLALAHRVARARASLSAGASESPEDVGGVEFPRRGGAHGEQRGRTRAGVGRAHGHAAQGVQVRPFSGADGGPFSHHTRRFSARRVGPITRMRRSFDGLTRTPPSSSHASLTRHQDHRVRTRGAVPPG